MPRKPGGIKARKRNHITLDDVAKVCGLSKMTVSRVLRDSDKVAADTRELVLEAARQVGYVPNRLAASFGRQESMIVGFVVPEISHAFFSNVMMAAEPILNAEGYMISLCCSYGRTEKELTEVRALLEWRVDGIVIAPVSTTESLEAVQSIRALGCPFVCLDRILPDMETDAVTSDDFGGAKTAVAHLIEQGYSNIAIITGHKRVWTSDERVRGYRAALEDAGLPVREQNIIHGATTLDSGMGATETLLGLPERPDAIFCFNDIVAAGALTVLKRNDISVPGEVGLVGYADIEHNEIVSPPLTSVSQDMQHLGEQCAKRLLERMRGTGIEAPEHYVGEARLVIRESSSRKSAIAVAS